MAETCPERAVEFTLTLSGAKGNGRRRGIVTIIKLGSNTRQHKVNYGRD